jgi:phytanoyl-CoA hydroxylase
MVITPGSHRRGPVVHFQRRDWQICDTHVNNQGALAVPLKPGGCLFFHSLMHHGTPTNNSDQRRRAVQYHYKPASAPKTSYEERLAVFGEEGKDVTC